MRRPHLGPRDRVRVEFRLPRAVAEAAYHCAGEWDVSLSEAGARLIESGYEILTAHSRSSWFTGRSVLSPVRQGAFLDKYSEKRRRRCRGGVVNSLR